MNERIEKIKNPLEREYTMSNIGHLLQDTRRNLGLSVEEIALETKLSIGSIRAYEQSRRTPSAASLKLLLHSLGLEKTGIWLSSDVWQSPDSSVYALAPFAGGHIRKHSGDIVITSVKDDLRIQVITQVLTASYDKLTEINSLLKGTFR